MRLSAWSRIGGGAPCGAVVVILGPVEEEKGDYTALCEGAVVARSLTLGKLAALLVRSDLYLGNDSGVSHLAAALGVATWCYLALPMLTDGHPAARMSP